MNLTESGVIDYLLYRGLINYDQALDERTTVSKNFSRNRNFLVGTYQEKNYFVKQASTGSAEKIKTLRTEANFYWLVNNDEKFSALRPFICRYFDYHPTYHILIIEAIKHKTDLYDIIRHKGIIDLETAALSGKALAGLHAVKYDQIKNTKADALFNKSVPWAFKMETDKMNKEAARTNATKQLFEIVNAHANYIDLINHARDAYSISCLIHGDMKFPNVVLQNIDEQQSVKIIDLEICDFGDPCWDVAGFFQSFLTWWIENTNANNQSLENNQPAINQFWQAYFNATEQSADKENELLIKSMQYTAIRMIQTTFEYSASQKELQHNQIKMLQMSLNILKNAKQACHDLFGII
jgi:hypothetical protein